MAVSALALQATDVDCLTNTGDGWACFLQAVTNAFYGPTVFGVIAGSMLVVALYIASNYHPAPPSIGTMLIGGVLIPWLPPQFHGIAQVVMVIGFITGVFFLQRRYSLEVGR